jgi:hypothetical protein
MRLYSGSFKGELREVFLIFVGITLSLLFNDWYNSLIENRTEHRLLVELKSNLLADIKVLSSCKNESEKAFMHTNRVINFLNSNATLDEQLKLDFGYLPTVDLVHFNNSAYESFKSIGFQIIENDSIRIYLSNYQGQQPRLSLRTEMILNHNVQNLWPILMLEFSQYKLWTKNNPKNIKQIKANRYLIGVLERTQQLRIFLSTDYDQMIDYLSGFIRKIDDRLK